MEDMIVIDDLLPAGYLKDLLALVNNKLTWVWVPETDYSEAAYNTNIWDKQMTATIIYDSQRVSQFCDYIYPVVHILEDKANIKVNGIFRLKINKTFTCPKHINITPWHVDGFSDNVKSIILHLDESDGDSVFSSVKMESDSNNPAINETLAMSGVISKVEYKPNRAILFDSRNLHYGEPPKKHKCRTVLNIVFQGS